MLRPYHLAASTLILLLIACLNNAISAEEFPVCEQLDEKASGDSAKFSLYGEANGPVFFSGINCAIEYRNRELCAMELSTFDVTSKVFDYYTNEEIEIGKAYFCLDEKNIQKPVVAFKDKESAEKYSAENEGSSVVDYTELTEKKFN